MATRLNLYDILGLSVSASGDAVKSAFRKAALQHHPDRSDRYDAYLRTSSVFAAPAASTAAVSTAGRQRLRIDSTGKIVQILLSHLNHVLWDIEDLLRSRPDWTLESGGIPVRGYIERMLAFIDAWILSPAGFPDYFFEARQLSVPPGNDPLFMGRSSGHRPFVSINDYFYNIRVRGDRFINAVTIPDLLRTVPETDVRIIDCIFEAHNLCTHYLGYLRRAVIDEVGSIPGFSHSHPCYER